MSPSLQRLSGLLTEHLQLPQPGSKKLFAAADVVHALGERITPAEVRDPSWQTPTGTFDPYAAGVVGGNPQLLFSIDVITDPDLPAGQWRLVQTRNSQGLEPLVIAHEHRWEECEITCEDCGSHSAIRCADEPCPDEYDIEPIDLVYKDDPR